MNNTEITIEVANLDGWVIAKIKDSVGNSYYRRIEDTKESGEEWRRVGDYPQSCPTVPEYLASRDAIIPVIEKFCNTDKLKVVFMQHLASPQGYYGWYVVTSTPLQLCTALLKAAGKWKE